MLVFIFVCLSFYAWLLTVVGSEWKKDSVFYLDLSIDDFLYVWLASLAQRFRSPFGGVYIWLSF